MDKPRISTLLIISRLNSPAIASSTFRVECDGHDIGSVDSGERLVVDVTPGLHYVRVSSLRSSSRVTEVMCAEGEANRVFCYAPALNSLHLRIFHRGSFLQIERDLVPSSLARDYLVDLMLRFSAGFLIVVIVPGACIALLGLALRYLLYAAPLMVATFYAILLLPLPAWIGSRHVAAGSEVVAEADDRCKSMLQPRNDTMHSTRKRLLVEVSFLLLFGGLVVGLSIFPWPPTHSVARTHPLLFWVIGNLYALSVIVSIVRNVRYRRRHVLQ